MDQRHVDEGYQGRPGSRRGPSLDIGRPQAALRELILRGLVRGPVLEVGCGTGENILQMASLGHQAWGIDASAKAVRLAREKARQRCLPVRFFVGNPLEPRGLGRRFNSVIDTGFFHGLSDPERIRYAERVAHVLNPGGLLAILCFSDKDPFDVGPRRVSMGEIVRTFHGAFGGPEVRAATFEVRPHGGVTRHRAWLATMRRRRIRPLRGLRTTPN